MAILLLKQFIDEHSSYTNSTWSQELNNCVVLPFREHQVSFFNPHVTCWSEALIPYESRAKEKCCILLYVITGHSTSVGSLVEVS